MSTSYCTIQHVIERVSSYDVTASSQRETDINNMIKKVSAYMNGVLKGAGYDVPVDAAGSEALEILQLICSAGVAFRVLSQEIGGTEETDYDRFGEEFRQGLEDIKSIPEFLHDAITTTDVKEEDVSSLLRCWGTTDTDESTREPEIKIDENYGA